MKTKKLLLMCIISVLTVVSVEAQGTFQNLDFEQANPIPLGSPSTVATTNGLLGWIAYQNDSQQSSVLYDTISLGGPAISLHDSASLNLQPIQGNYSVLLQGSGVFGPASAAIGQTGQVPVDAISLRFWADPRSMLQVTFGGQMIPMFRLESTPNYDIFGGDISMLAGQTGELRFTGPANSGGYFDNIFFSIQPIPEPSALCLFGLGTLLLGRRWRRF